MRKGRKLTALCLTLALLALPCSQVFAMETESAGVAEAESNGGDTWTVSESLSDGETRQIHETYINPLYADVMEVSDLKQAPAVLTLAEGETDETEYADTVEEAAEQIREGMKQRQETIEVYYQAPEYVDGMMAEIAQAGLEHTGDPREGDYLRWQYGGWNASGSIRRPEGEDVCYMTFTYTYTYYTTAEQEAAVDTRIGQVLESLDVADTTDYTKLAGIYDYICSHTVYDYDTLNDDSYKLKYTAYAALIDEKAVCQGYAVLFYRMALELGVDSRLIAGTGNSEAHGWNIAGLDGLYYNLDTTWDAGAQEYAYFLKCEENFGSHTRYQEYDTEAFHAAYPMASEDYQPKENEIRITSVYSQVQNWAKVTWTKVPGASGYELYRSESPDAAEDAWKLTKTIREADTVQYTNTGLETGKTYYYKVRAFFDDGSGNVAYSDFSNVGYMPAAVVFDNVYSNLDSRIRILWDQVQGAHGYQIWRQNADGIWSIVKTIGDRDNTLTEDMGDVTAYSNTGLEAGQTYTYKMRAFSIQDGKKVFGVYSDPCTAAVMPSKPVISGESTKSGKITLTWNRLNGAAGYQIWRADSENGSYSIVKSITDGDTVTYTNSAESGKTYYYKVRGYVELDGKKTFGEYSDILRVQAK